MQRTASVCIWAGIFLLIIIWLPLLAVRWLFDRDPFKYKTGRLFRILGLAISRINPNWKISLSGYTDIDDRRPYIIVSNHLSNADIPVISNLPWEMKWVAKKELFELPVLGWMMNMARDISVDRTATGKKLSVFKKCRSALHHQVSVFFFPEGTRSRSGKLQKFSPGAFNLSIKEQIPILPIVLDGTQGCLPKKTWVFKPNVHVQLKVLEPVDPAGFGSDGNGVAELMKTVRNSIADQLMEWRGKPRHEVDATLRSPQDDDASDPVL